MGVRPCAVRYPMLQCKVLPVVSWVPRDTALRMTPHRSTHGRDRCVGYWSRSRLRGVTGWRITRPSSIKIDVITAHPASKKHLERYETLSYVV